MYKNISLPATRRLPLAITVPTIHQPPKLSPNSLVSIESILLELAKKDETPGINTLIELNVLYGVTPNYVLWAYGNTQWALGRLTSPPV